MLHTLENATRNILMKYATCNATTAQQVHALHRGFRGKKCNHNRNNVAN